MASDLVSRTDIVGTFRKIQECDKLVALLKAADDTDTRETLLDMVETERNNAIDKLETLTGLSVHDFDFS